jgi:HAD superfamily hydrolase (TIGR01662 family)
METLLGKERAYLNAIYYCPHHPDAGYPEERKEYKIKCTCRKPAPGMLLKAAQDWNIDLANSYMIGDRMNDKLAGEAAGCKDSRVIATNAPNALLNVIKEIV